MIFDRGARLQFYFWLAVIDDGDGFFDVVVSFVNVTENSHLQAASFRIVFFLAAIVARVV